uniref:Flagellin n=1 Tax=Rhodopseudomonas palustris (strain BisA53) TaxID=316055 RepID=Q07RF9_RHOP5
MSNVVLSASVRQNLLSLQSTADLLATTQNRLASGKKVNSALDNPTNFFTAAGLDSRSSDINNLLDGISNGVQILQAANTGITSLNKLIDTAKSIASQALQSNVGYTKKSNVAATIAGATPEDLRGTQTFASATATSNVIYDGTLGGTSTVLPLTTLGGGVGTIPGGVVASGSAADATAVAANTISVGTAAATATAADLISSLTNGATPTATGPQIGDILVVDGKTITFDGTSSSTPDGNGNYTIGINQTISSLLATIDAINGNVPPTSTMTGGKIVLHSGTNRSLAVSDMTGGGVMSKLGLAASVTVPLGAAGGNMTTNTKLFNTVGGLSTTPIADGTTLTVNGKTVTFKASDPPTPAGLLAGSGVLGNIVTDSSNNSTIYLGTSNTYTPATVGDIMTAIDVASGVKSVSIANGIATYTSNGSPSSITGGALTLRTSTGADLNINGPADLLNQLSLTASTGPGPTTISQPRITSGATTGTLIKDGSTLNVNGKTITFANAPVPLASATHTGITGHIETDGVGNSTVYLQGGTMADVLTAIDLATGVQTAKLAASGATLTTQIGSANSSLSGGSLKISTGTAADLTVTGTGNAMLALGLAGNTGTSTEFAASRSSGTGGVSGKSMTFTSFKGGTPVNITFGDGTGGTVKSLSQLNAKLATNNMIAQVDANGLLTISTGNDYASSTLGSIADGGVLGGTITATLTFTTPQEPVADTNSQLARANLVRQFNNVIAQISTTSQDASFNGVNLLNGDTLKLVFNETGKSTLNIVGTALTAAQLGLSTLVEGFDFIDNAATNKTMAALNTASTSLRSQASAYGSNLSIVQIRQDFSKNLISVLQTGSSNLTLADTNEEAANSQALSTRQSIAVSALALANQSQQSVLKLLQ